MMDRAHTFLPDTKRKVHIGVTTVQHFSGENKQKILHERGSIFGAATVQRGRYKFNVQQQLRVLQMQRGL
jgi:hypothetical protein